MKLELEAEQDFDPPYLVSVRLGRTEVAALKPVTRSRAGDGDDSSYHLSEARRVVEETVAEWLRACLREPR